MANNFCPACGIESLGTPYCAHCGARQTAGTTRFTYDWWSIGGSGTHSNYNNLEREITRVNVVNLQPRWVREIEGGLASQVIIAEGRLYFGSKSATAYCADASTGHLIWRQAESGRQDTTPTYVNGWVWGSYDRWITRLDGKDGSENTQYTGESWIGFGDGYSRNDIVCNENYLVAINYNFDTLQLANLNANPPHIRSIAHRFGGWPSSPAFVSSHEFVVFKGNNVQVFGCSEYGLSESDAIPLASDSCSDNQCIEVHWPEYQLAVTNFSIAASVGLINAEDCEEYASHSITLWWLLRVVDLQNNKALWDFSSSMELGNPAIADQRLIIGSEDGQLMCLDAMSGEVLWQRSYPGSGSLTATPLVADEVVYFIGYDGLVGAADLQSGNLLWSDSVNCRLQGAPAICSGILYVGSDRGLHAYSL